MPLTARRNPSSWSRHQLNAMHWLQHSTHKSARAWRLKIALREVCAQARSHNSQTQAANDQRSGLSWARRCRLEPFKKLAATLKERFDAMVWEMVDHRSNALVEAMNCLLQQAKRAARAFRASANFIAVAYLRMSKPKHLPPARSHRRQPSEDEAFHTKRQSARWFQLGCANSRV